MILLLDNRDSFVHNVARYCRLLGADVAVHRSDTISLADIERLQPKALIISPGPSSPKDAGVSLAAVKALSGHIPILGICLGHQCLGEVFGGTVVRASEPMHGRASLITHDGAGLFDGLPSPLKVGRYHSLIVTLQQGSNLRVTATSTAGEIMGLQHDTHPTYGVQFHPESILTEHGLALMANFLRLIA